MMESLDIVHSFLEKNNYSKLVRYPPRFLITFLIYIIAFCLPKLSTFINLIGALSGITL